MVFNQSARKILPLALGCVILASLAGCRTYFGYEAKQETKDDKDSIRKTASTLRQYRIEVIDGRVVVWADYKDSYEKERVTWEDREHIYLKDASPLKYILPIPLRAPFDIFACMTDWNLASNPPGFTQQLFYVPPFCWFAAFTCPPYWLENPKKLSEGENVIRPRKRGEDEDTHTVTKTIERERVPVKKEKISYSDNSTQRVTQDSADISIGQKHAKILLSDPLISLEQLDTKALPPRTVAGIIRYKGAEKRFHLNTWDSLSSEQKSKWNQFLQDVSAAPLLALYRARLIDKEECQALLLEKIANMNPENLVQLHHAGILPPDFSQKWLALHPDLSVDTLILLCRNQLLSSRNLLARLQKCRVVSASEIDALHQAELLNPEFFRNWLEKHEFADRQEIMLLKNAQLISTEEVDKLSKRLDDGEFHQKNPRFERYALAAASSDAKTGSLVCRYQSQKDVPVTDREIPTAMKWLKESAQKGDGKSSLTLGLLHMTGSILPKNPEEGVKWIRKAAEQGNPDACYLLGVCCLNGEYVKKDLTEGIQWVQKAAEKGNCDAQYSLGVSYVKGEYVKQDFATGIQWIRKAAEQGEPKAEIILGSAYFSGEGAPQDYEKATLWFKKAADHGNIDAQIFLGTCYFMGKGVPRDYEEAINCFKKAAEGGSGKAQLLLAQCYQEGSGVPLNYAESFRWYRKAAETGNPDAQYFLATYYWGKSKFPMLMIQNLPEAEKWMQKAASQKHPDASKDLPALTAQLKDYNAAIQEREKEEKSFEYYSKNANPTIETVKNTVFQLDDTRTLEEALASQMSNIRWRVFQSKENRTIVEVVGIWKSEKFKPSNDAPQNLLVFALTTGAQQILQICPQKDEEVMAQFVITKDGNVRFHFGECRNSKGVRKIGCSPMITYPAYTDDGEFFIKKEGFFEMLYGK